MACGATRKSPFETRMDKRIMDTYKIVSKELENLSDSDPDLQISKNHKIRGNSEKEAAEKGLS